MTTIIVGDEARYLRRCKGCQKWFYPSRADAKTCSPAYRKLISDRAKCEMIRSEDDQRVLAIRPWPLVDFHRKDAFTVVLPPDLIEKIKAHGELVVSVHDLKPIDPPPPPERRARPTTKLKRKAVR